MSGCDFCEGPEWEAEAQALADLRALDDWAEKTGSRAPSPAYNAQWRHWTISVLKPFSGFVDFDGATPDEARAKTAAWVREQK